MPDTGEEEVVIDETKCTEKKVRSGEDFLLEWMWMHQGREYGFVYNARVVRWAIMFYRGNWDGQGPVCKEYVVRFSDKECAQTHAMLVTNKSGTEMETGR